MDIPKGLLVAVLCFASANGIGNPCTTMGPAPLVPIGTVTTTPGLKYGPCATSPPGKQIGIDVGIGLGSAALAGAVGGLVVILHDEMTTRGYPTLPPKPPYFEMNPVMMSKVTNVINNKTKTIVDKDVAVLAGGISTFMIVGGIVLFLLLAAALHKGFKKTKTEIREEGDKEMKQAKKTWQEGVERRGGNDAQLSHPSRERGQKGKEGKERKEKKDRK